MPHHITQRGNRRQPTFFCDDDYAAYLDLMAEWCGEQGVEIWAYCLMPNHTHLIAVPQTEDGLRRALGEAHRRYTRHINFREKWRGYLWQGRFASSCRSAWFLVAFGRPSRRRVCSKPSRLGRLPCRYLSSKAGLSTRGRIVTLDASANRLSP